MNDVHLAVLFSEMEEEPTLAALEALEACGCNDSYDIQVAIRTARMACKSTRREPAAPLRSTSEAPV